MIASFDDMAGPQGYFRATHLASVKKPTYRTQTLTKSRVDLATSSSVAPSRAVSDSRCTDKFRIPELFRHQRYVALFGLRSTIRSNKLTETKEHSNLSDSSLAVLELAQMLLIILHQGHPDDA
jgi:hypothetical protein